MGATKFRQKAYLYCPELLCDFCGNQHPLITDYTKCRQKCNGKPQKVLPSIKIGKFSTLTAMKVTPKPTDSSVLEESRPTAAESLKTEPPEPDCDEKIVGGMHPKDSKRRRSVAKESGDERTVVPVKYKASRTRRRSSKDCTSSDSSRSSKVENDTVIGLQPVDASGIDMSRLNPVVSTNKRFGKCLMKKYQQLYINQRSCDALKVTVMYKAAGSTKSSLSVDYKYCSGALLNIHSELFYEIQTNYVCLPVDLNSDALIVALNYLHGFPLDFTRNMRFEDLGFTFQDLVQCALYLKLWVLLDELQVYSEETQRKSCKIDFEQVRSFIAKLPDPLFLQDVLQPHEAHLLPKSV